MAVKGRRYVKEEVACLEEDCDWWTSQGVHKADEHADTRGHRVETIKRVRVVVSPGRGVGSGVWNQARAARSGPVVAEGPGGAKPARVGGSSA